MLAAQSSRHATLQSGEASQVGQKLDYLRLGLLIGFCQTKVSVFKVALSNGVDSMHTYDIVHTASTSASEHRNDRNSN